MIESEFKAKYDALVEAGDTYGALVLSERYKSSPDTATDSNLHGRGEEKKESLAPNLDQFWKDLETDEGRERIRERLHGKPISNFI